MINNNYYFLAMHSKFFFFEVAKIKRERIEKR